MKFKKFAAAAVAAAMLAGAPSNVLPFSLSAEVSAESDYDPSKHFLAVINPDGEIIGYPEDSMCCYYCEVKDDGTLKIGFDYWLPVAMFPDAFPGETVIIPNEIKGYKVTELSSGFSYLACKKIIIPDTVTTIDQSAFAFSYFLEEIEFGANSKLKSIEQWAFQDCRSLKTLNLPASVETIGYQAFVNSTNNDLSGYAYHSGAYDFNDTFSLTTVNIPLNAKLKTIGEGAFANQKSLTSITIPEKTNSIADDAFRNTALKTITGVIGSYAETYADENGYDFIGVPSAITENVFMDNSEDSAAKIQVAAMSDVVPEEAVLFVRTYDSLTNEKQTAYNCWFTYNGEKYEPDGNITVKIPLPAVRTDSFKVYQYQDNKFTVIDTTVENGYWVFETDNLGIYVISATEPTAEEKPEDPDNSPDDSTKPGGGSDDPTKPGNDSDDTTKPGDGSDDTTKPGDGSNDPTKPGDGTLNPIGSNAGAGKPTTAGNDNEHAPNTGAAITIIPIIAASAALVIFKKKK